MKTNYLNLQRDSINHVNKVLKEIEGKEKVVFYFHGGLSSDCYVKSALGPMLLKTILSQDILSTKNFKTHVVFMQYNAELKFFDREVEKEIKKIQSIRGWDKLSEEINKNAEKYLKEEKENIPSNIVTSRERENYLEAKFVIYIDEELIKDIKTKGISEDDLKRVDKYITKQNNTEGYIGIKELWKKVEKRYKSGTDHGKVTVLEEGIKMRTTLASKHWQRVYRNSEEMWTTENGEYFLEGLKNICSTTNTNLKIDLISHSAGSIPISYLIKNSVNISMKFNNVLMIVPAIRFKTFQENIIPNQEVFDNLKVYLLDDKSEVEDNVVKLYKSSLLYLVSGIAEIDNDYSDMTIIGMHRYYKDVMPYSTYIEDKEENIKYGNVLDVKNYFTSISTNSKMVFVSKCSTVQDNFGMPIITTRGATHGDTKIPYESFQLAKDIVLELTGSRINIDNTNYRRRWMRQKKKYLKIYRLIRRGICFLFNKVTSLF